MGFDLEKPRRRSLRWPTFDYAEAGAYFVTVCAQGKKCLFGKVVDGEMRLNDAGRMVKSVWDELATQYAGVETDAFVTMPNHMHGIIVLVGAAPCGRPHVGVQAGNGQPRGVAPTMSLPDVVHRFKTHTTKRYADGVKTLFWPRFHRRLWQRNYFEHVIRDDAEWNLVREYIVHNPERWGEDEENPYRKAEERPG